MKPIHSVKIRKGIGQENKMNMPGMMPESAGPHIRPATEADAEALLEIYRYYVENTAVSFEWVTPTIAQFRERIRKISARYPYFCAEMDGKIVGYAYAGEFKSRAAYAWSVETTVYLERDARRHGVGRALYAALAEALHKMGVRNMCACIAVPTKEDKTLTFDSMHFHEHMGFHLVGRFTASGCKFGRWYDMIWMEKMIGEHTENPCPVIPYPEVSARK